MNDLLVVRVFVKVIFTTKSKNTKISFTPTSSTMDSGHSSCMLNHLDLSCHWTKKTKILVLERSACSARHPGRHPLKPSSIYIASQSRSLWVIHCPPWQAEIQVFTFTNVLEEWSIICYFWNIYSERGETSSTQGCLNNTILPTLYRWCWIVDVPCSPPNCNFTLPSCLV